MTAPRAPRRGHLRLAHAAHPARAVIAARFAGAESFGAAFHAGSANRCPGCGGTSFFVGRITAECMTCACPLPLAPTRRIPFQKGN